MKQFHNKNILPFYVKGLAAGKYTLKQAAESTGYNWQYLSRLKQRYLKEGDLAFIHKNKNITPVNKISKEVRETVALYYSSECSDVNFRYFQEILEEDKNVKISYPTLVNILHEYGQKSPRKHKSKSIKKVHPPRPRRLNEGDMLQIDGTPFPWFSWAGDYTYYTIQASIDDATGKLTAMYMTENECLYGYMEMLRRSIDRFGIPREIYSDRAGLFCFTPRNKQNLSIIEQLGGVHEKHTQWQRILETLSIRQILAWSPQAKGRVERMWETVQGRLPHAFKKAKIKTLDAANKFLETWIDYFNSKFSVKAKSDVSFYRENDSNLDSILCARFPRRTNVNGVLSFHGYKMQVMGAKYVACKQACLCISERGLNVELNGLYYNVRILSDLDEGPDWEGNALKKILYDYLYRDSKQVSA